MREAREVIARLETRRAYIAAGGYGDVDAFVNESWPNQVGFADAILTALSSAGIDCEGWRTIESAPKDGTRFLGVTLNDVVVLVWWDESEHQGKGAWTDGTVESWGYEEVHTFKLKAWRPLPPLASGGG